MVIYQSIGKRLTKTIAVIVAASVTESLPTLVILNILANAAMNSPDIKFLQNMAIVNYWALIPCQLNAVLNSVIYLARISRIKNIIATYLIVVKRTKS